MRDRYAFSAHITKVLIICLLGGSLVVFLIRIRRSAIPDLYHRSEFLLDTLVELTVAAPNERQAQDAMAAAYAEMRRVEALLSRYVETSQIARINRAAGEEQFVPVEPEVTAIVRRSLDYAEATTGLFDITIGSLIDLWGIGTEQEHVPAETELGEVLRLINYRDVELQGERGIRLRYPEMALDLGGIAKGYSIDRAIEVLRAHHVSSGLLNAGGDICCIGLKPDGKPWRIGIQHPREKSTMAGIIELKEGAVVTSGDYERYFIHQDTRYHHIFDPETGMPVRECQSVTILADTAERADVLATAVFIMGPEQGKTFLEHQAGVEGMIIRADGERVMSSGFSMQQVQ
jgi:thiamine biosynthesis lipoprotein